MDVVLCCCCWTKEWNISNGLLFDDTLFVGGDEAAAAGVAVVADEGPNGSKRLNGLLDMVDVMEADRGCAGAAEAKSLRIHPRVFRYQVYDKSTPPLVGRPVSIR